MFWKKIKMNFLNKDLIFYLGLRLDPYEILKFSQASKKCNQVLCSNNLFWRSKLLRDYFSGDEIKDFLMTLISKNYIKKCTRINM